MRCRDIVGHLPWLLNGSLSAELAAGLRAHVAACTGCRAELAETLVSAQILTAHIPVSDLVAYASGTLGSNLDRHDIERHLGLCASCREEAELLGSDEPASLDVIAAERAFMASYERRRSDTAPRLRTSEPTRRRFDSVRWLVAAAVVLAAITGLPGRGGDEPDEGTTANRVTARAEVASQEPHLMFGDGFESADLTAWSIAATAYRVTPNNPKTGENR